MRLIIGLFTVLLLVIGGFYLSQKYLKDVFPFPQKTTTAAIRNNKFNLLIAKTDKEKEIGLSEKSSIDKDSGMLFVFDKPDYHKFWMKNMKFPIDILFLNKNHIITIHSKVPAPQDTALSKDENLPIYSPEEPSDMVIEINSGLSETYGFQKGDSVKIENL